MDCNTATNNYHHHHRQHNHHLTITNCANTETLTPALNPVSHDKDVSASDCQVVIPLQFPNHYREFISDNRVCELNRYKYYQHLHSHPAVSASAQHSAIGNYDGKVLEGFSGTIKEPQSNALLDLMDSAHRTPQAAAAAVSVAAGSAQMDIVDNNRLSLQQQLQSDGAIIIDCHNNPLAKYRDIDGQSTNPGKYHMEANIYMCNGIGSQDTAGGDFARTEHEFGKDQVY